MDWTAFSTDPLDGPLQSRVHDRLSSISGVFEGDLTTLFCTEARDTSVLHIGCFEHDEMYVRSPNWKHRQIDAAASRCKGVDINANGIALMSSMGFDAVVADATGPDDLGERFKLIIIGDVIEHLLDFGGLIAFAKRHLDVDGAILVSTPNPFYVGAVSRAWRRAPSIANLEHTCFIAESNMLEIARRTGLSLARISYPLGRSASNAVARTAKQLSWGLRSTSLFTTIVYRLTAV